MTCTGVNAFLVTTCTAVSDSVAEEDELTLPPVAEPLTAVTVQRVNAETEFAVGSKRFRSKYAVGSCRNVEQPVSIVVPNATCARTVNVYVRREYVNNEFEACVAEFLFNAEEIPTGLRESDVTIVVNEINTCYVRNERSAVVAEFATVPSCVCVELEALVLKVLEKNIRLIILYLVLNS